MITKKVLEEAQKHFDCASLTGVALEARPPLPTYPLLRDSFLFWIRADFRAVVE